MPYCYVPRCPGGSKGQQKSYQEQNLPPLHFFQPPSEEARKQWETLIKRDEPLQKKHKVCSAHFLDKDVITHDEVVINGELVRTPRIRAALRPGALPVLFHNYPKYYQPKVNLRRSPKKRNSDQIPKNNKRKKTSEEVLNTTPDDPEGNENILQSAHDDLQTQSESAPSAASDLQKEKEEINTVTWSCLEVTKLVLPVNWMVCNTLGTNEKIVAHMDPKSMQINKTIIFKGSDTPLIKIEGKPYSADIPEKITSLADAQKILNKVDLLKVCNGTGLESGKVSVACEGGISQHAKRCKACKAERDRQQKLLARQKKLKQAQAEKLAKHKSKVQSLRRSKVKLLYKIKQYKLRVENAIRECEKKSSLILDEAINKLPPAQQEAVKACFDAAKRKGPSGRRYTTKWVYECMLMRIKDKKLYNHIRFHNILPLPTVSTINGYLKNYGSAFGYQLQTFEMLKEKTFGMQSNKRRGILMVDEMKLTKGAYFEQDILKVGGMKDMGEEAAEALGQDFHETVEEAMDKLPKDPNAEKKRQQREKRQEKNDQKRDKNLGDHALVISFQPFMGKWVQTLGCFLTRGNATDEELTKLLLEGVVLCEKSNLLVDAVVNDGAGWNRSMWKKFGVSEDNPNVEHPCNPEKKLYFFSDFPHLLKCMRNCLVSKKIILTPNGDVKLDHWKAVVKADSIRQVGLRECHKLTVDHLDPNPWQKMNCRMAWEFWSRSAAAGMESFKLQGVDALDDCHASVDMCIKINDLADAMNSNRPQIALKLNSPEYAAIEDFLDYFIKLKEWANERLHEKLKAAEVARVALLRAQGKNPRGKSEESLRQENYIFSDSTDIGLIVSLKNALELSTHLIKTCQFKYVMTARFNQDALERFFGLVRQSCGRNTHPEPRVFAQLFRLLSIYSLVKPIRGSNVTGGEMVTTLLTLDDLKLKTRKERHEALYKKLDEIILNGENLDDIPEIFNNIDHDYLMESVDEFAVSYVTGFVAKYAKRFAKDCESCNSTLKKPESERTDVDMLITLKSKGYYTYPSNDLVELIRSLEVQVVRTAVNNELEENLLFVVLDNLENVKVTKIGCAIHDHELTKSIMKFFLITRMHFITKRWNEKNIALTLELPTGSF